MGSFNNTMAGNPSVDAVLSSLPADAEQQLEVGLHVLRHAFRKKGKELETDNANMNQFGKEKQNQVVMLEQKVSSLEDVVDDMSRTVKDLAAENARVAAERDSLADNVKKLTRDMKRLDHFKKSILNTIETDEEKPSQQQDSYDRYSSQAPAPVQARTPSPLRAPAAPKTPPKGTSADELIAQIDRTIDHRSAQDPPEYGASSRFPDISAGTGASEAAAVDGKEFFKKARHRLSFQQFNEFLANIKKLNSHLQTRDETLAKADDILGPDNQDLNV